MSVEMDKGNYEFSEYGDIHTIGSLLKKFFKELPDPAVPVGLYDDFVTCAKETNEEERLSMLKELVYRLPTAHYHTVKFLMKHLKKVAAHSDQNKVSTCNVISFVSRGLSLTERERLGGRRERELEREGEGGSS